LNLSGSTGPVFQTFENGGLLFPFEQLLLHGFAFDLEAVQTERTSDSRTNPQRPGYDMIQTAVDSPNNTVCMQ